LLNPGTKLGPYEIQSSLGAGGMGEVYRARDTRLERIVAVKILPAHLSASPEAKHRFEREAKAISSLSHPNICHLYDVGAQDGVDFLVMEYLEGETLAERLKKGPLTVEALLRCGMEIAEGLDKAHRSGVVHRDLKPGNIMLTKTGAKLMDFGLAKAGAVSSASALTQSISPALGAPAGPTFASPTMGSPGTPLTAQGVVVGTFQYMSPEQVEGKEADARSDIFALGAVLYEMATGKRAFEGKSAASAMAAVLERDPAPISSLQPTSPPALDLVVKTCLAKDPDQRFQSAHDVALQLRWLAQAPQAATASTSAAAPAAAAKPQRPLLAWGVAALALLAAIGIGVYHFTNQKPPRVLRAQIVAPEKFIFNFAGDNAGPPVLSPDGAHMVFSAIMDRKSRLYLRAIDSIAVQALPGTEDATFPFWSPDSRSLGFFANGKMKRIDISGGPAVTLCDAPIGRGGTWSAEGVILFTPYYTAPISRVSANGGTPVVVTKLEGNHTTHRWPWFLPDGQHFLYLAANHKDPQGADTGVFVASLDGKENRLLLRTTSNAIYASGYLLFSRENALVVQVFDASSRQLKGEPALVGENARVDKTVWRGTFTASDNGTLVYQPGAAANGVEMTWFDRSGKATPSGAAPDAYREVQISPDGKKLALSIGQPYASLWVYEIARNTKTRLTFGNEHYSNFAWSPDGGEIAYTVWSPVTGAGTQGRTAMQSTAIRSKASSGAGEERQLVEPSAERPMLSDWSPDGRYLMYQTGVENSGGAKLWALPLVGDRKPIPYTTWPGTHTNAQFSPDGRWVAYESNETGRYEIYVAPFPATGAKWVVSTDGGLVPRWRGDGKEIFYLSPNGAQMMSAQVSGKGAGFEVGEVRPLLPINNISPDMESEEYVVTRDGQRFVILTTGEVGSSPPILVQNWTAELKR
jgi:Tol biopolymer transport system component/predicted Ser/Thr protein kinase